MPNPILTGKASTLAGFPSMPYDLNKLHAILALMEYRGTTYGLIYGPAWLLVRFKGGIRVK